MAYLVYSTMPKDCRRYFKFTIDEVHLKVWFKEALKRKRLPNLILRKMLRDDYFVIGRIVGLKTITIDKYGQIKRESKCLLEGELETRKLEDFVEDLD